MQQLLSQLRQSTSFLDLLEQFNMAITVAFTHKTQHNITYLFSLSQKEWVILSLYLLRSTSFERIRQVWHTYFKLDFQYLSPTPCFGWFMFGFQHNSICMVIRKGTNKAILVWGCGIYEICGEKPYGHGLQSINRS